MGKMNFEEFKQEVIDHIKEFLPEKYQDAEVSVNEVIKNNGLKLDGLVIKAEESNVSPSIYLQSFYKNYENGAELGEVMTQIATMRVENEVEQNIDVSKVMDFEQVKDQIIPRLVGMEHNQELLSNRPYKEVDGLAVTYYINVDMVDQKDVGMASIAVSDMFLHNWGITAEELHEVALHNMETITPATFQSMSEVMASMMMDQMIADCNGDREQAQAMMDAMIPKDEMMFVLSNEQKINGATVLLSEKTMDMVVDRVGKEFFILPSSVHECLIVPKQEGMELENLESMVREVNANEVALSDQLSDYVYAYDADTHEIYRADHEAEHMQAKEAAKEMNQEPKKEKASIKEKLAEKKKEVEKAPKAASVDKSKNKNAAID